MKGKKGFTLIELLVVIIIVGILAAISIPMMTANLARARRSEAQAALGSIRTAQRVYRTEHVTYTINLGDLMVTSADLDGIYYNGANTQMTASATTFTATISGKATGAESGKYVSLSDAGVWANN